MFIIYNKQLFTPSIAVLLGLVLFNTGKYCYNISMTYYEKGLFYGQMDYKPNIYIMVLESYQGNEALKKLYNYDNQSFMTDLEKIGFNIYHNVYSNVSATRGSLSSIFAINDLSSIPLNFIDKLLTNPKKFKLSNTFLKNEYQIDYMFPTDYLTQMDSRCLVTQKASLFTLNSRKYRKPTCAIKYESFEDFMNKLNKFLTIKRKKKVLFIAKIGGVSEFDTSYHDGLTHIPNIYRHTDKKHLLPKLRADYIDNLQKENVLIQNTIQTIIKNDPNGLIVLLGDHGGQFFEIYDRQYGEKILPLLKKEQIDKKDYILDMYNIFLAIKWPEQIKTEATIDFAPELFKLILERIIPNVQIPKPSRTLFEIDGKPVKDIFWQDI